MPVHGFQHLINVGQVGHRSYFKRLHMIGVWDEPQPGRRIGLASFLIKGYGVMVGDIRIAGTGNEQKRAMTQGGHFAQGIDVCDGRQ